MTALPAAADFTGSSVTEADFKSAITDLRAYLAGLHGTDGTAATALATLGSLLTGYTAKSGNYTVLAADRGKLINCTATLTLTTPAAATVGAGFAFGVRNSGAGTVTLDGNAAETVDGTATVALVAGESALVVSTGTAWVTLGRNQTIPDPPPVEWELVDSWTYSGVVGAVDLTWDPDVFHYLMLEVDNLSCNANSNSPMVGCVTVANVLVGSMPMINSADLSASVPSFGAFYFGVPKFRDTLHKVMFIDGWGYSDTFGFAVPSWSGQTVAGTHFDTLRLYFDNSGSINAGSANLYGMRKAT